MATQNPYSDSLLMDALRGSLSNAESLGRGFAVAPVGLLGDINALARQYVTPRLPQSVQGLLQSAPAAPTTEQILSNIPRVSNPRMETAGMEQLGAAMNPRGPVDLARGVGRVAGNAINEAMVYDRGLLAGITPQPMRMDVYHGSPYGPFNKFDPSKARTGEGNATYGEGAYLAQARGTGEAYRRQLAKESQAMDLGAKLNMVDVGGTPLTKFNVDQSPELLDAAKAGKTQFVDLARTKLNRWEDMAKDSSYPFPDYAKEKITAYKGLLDAADKSDVNYTGSGFLYKVDLPDEAIPKMLDWDKPLSQQTPEVRQALEKVGYQVDKTKVSEFDDALLNALVNDGPTTLPKQPLDLSGEAIYTKLKQSFANNERLNAERDALIGKYQKEGMSWSNAVRSMSKEDRSNFVDIANKIESQKNAGLMASEELQKQGITGIRYLDQMSRDVGDGTSNFVVFPQYQDLLTIKEINDQPVQGLLGR
jgi:hypothetical protein